MRHKRISIRRLLRSRKLLPPLSARGIEIGDRIAVIDEDLWRQYLKHYGIVSDILEQPVDDDFFIEVKFPTMPSSRPGYWYTEYFNPSELEITEKARVRIEKARGYRGHPTIFHYWIRRFKSSTKWWVMGKVGLLWTCPECGWIHTNIWVKHGTMTCQHYIGYYSEVQNELRKISSSN